MVLAEIIMEPNASVVQVLPANFNTFIYAIDGNVLVGEEKTILAEDQVGWLDLHKESTGSELILEAGQGGARLILYSAEPQHHEIVSHGPFIADTMEDIKQLYADFRYGKMKHITEVSAEQKLVF
jgi:quercetin 2,3-dioxygenase